MTIQEKAKQLLAKQMDENPIESVMWMMLILGKQMLDANAKTMRMKQDADLRIDERYTIELSCKITKHKK